MRSSIISCVALLGVSLAVSPNSGVQLNEAIQTAFITVHPEACQARSAGVEVVLPTPVSSVASEADLSTTTIFSTSTHVVWATEAVTAEEPVFAGSLSKGPVSYEPFTPPVAPLSCDNAPILTYISETVWETLPATTVTMTSVATTTVVIHTEFHSTTTSVLTLTQAPVTVTDTVTATATAVSTATVTATPSSVLLTVTSTVTAIQSQGQITATPIITTASSIGSVNGTGMAPAPSQISSTSVNVVPVDSKSVPVIRTSSSSTSLMLQPTSASGTFSPTDLASSTLVRGSPLPSSVPASSPAFSSSPPVSSAPTGYVSSAPMTSSSPSNPASSSSPIMFTPLPSSSMMSGTASLNPIHSTGWNSLPSFKPSMTTSPIMTAPSTTSTPTSCIAPKNMSLNFDNLPVTVHKKESVEIPSPYDHFVFSKGWIYGKSAAVAHALFPASSGNSMAAYVPSLSPNSSIPGSFGILANDTEVAHGFNIHSLRFGCNGLGAPKDEICRVLVTGVPVDANLRRHAIEIDIEPCTFADGCALAIIDLPPHMFPALKAMQFQASIANQTVGWFIDDIELTLNAKCSSGSSNVQPAPVYGGQKRGIVRRRSITYEPFTGPVQAK